MNVTVFSPGSGARAELAPRSRWGTSTPPTQMLCPRPTSCTADLPALPLTPIAMFS